MSTLSIPTIAKPGEASISSVIAHVVAICDCPAHPAIVFDVGPGDTACPSCGIRRRIKTLTYEVEQTPEGPLAHVEVNLEGVESPKVEIPAHFGRIQH